MGVGVGVGVEWPRWAQWTSVGGQYLTVFYWILSQDLASSAAHGENANLSHSGLHIT